MTFFCVLPIVFSVLLKCSQVYAKTNFDPEVIEGTVGVLYTGYVSSGLDPFILVFSLIIEI